MPGLNTETLLGLARLDDYLTYGSGVLQAAADDLANKGGGVLLIGGSAYPQQAGNPTLAASVALFVLPGGRLPGTAGQTLTIDGTLFSAEDASTIFPGWGTRTINGRQAVAGGTVNVPMSAAVPQAETFGATGAAGSTGTVSDAGHVHPLGATAGGDLTGSYPNPAVGAGAITAAKLAAGAATGAALGADVLTLTGAQSPTNKTFDATSNAALRIAGQVLGASAAAITFAAIPTTYRMLIVLLLGRGDAAATGTGVYAQFSGDTGANYDFQTQTAVGSSVTAQDFVGATNIQVGSISAASAPAGAAGSIIAFIPGYAQTTYRKTMTWQSAYKTADAAGGLQVIAGAGHWRSTATITQVTLLAGAGNFAAGTVAALLAIP